MFLNLFSLFMIRGLIGFNREFKELFRCEIMLFFSFNFGSLDFNFRILLFNFLKYVVDFVRLDFNFFIVF